MVLAQKLIKISVEFIFPNDPQTHHLIHEKAMVKSADKNLSICFLAQTASIYTVSQTCGLCDNCRSNKFRVAKSIILAQGLAQ